MQQCRNYCTFLEKTIINRKSGIWDKDNASFCKMCDIYLFTPEYKCPCCKSKLRKNPHGKYSKDRLNG